MQGGGYKRPRLGAHSTPDDETRKWLDLRGPTTEWAIRAT